MEIQEDKKEIGQAWAQGKEKVEEKIKKDSQKAQKSWEQDKKEFKEDTKAVDQKWDQKKEKVEESW